MDYEELTMEHMGWPHELSVYVRKPDGSLKASEIEPDDRCGLGKWIRTEGAVHRSLPEYSKLMDAHARIHQVTADIVRHADCTGRQGRIQGRFRDVSFGTDGIQAEQPVRHRSAAWWEETQKSPQRASS